MFTVDIHLNKTQYNKANKGLTFQLSHDQMQKHDEANATVQLASKSDLNRLNRNFKNGKGFRFSASSYQLHDMDDMEGGNIFKKAGRAIRKTAKSAVKQGRQHANKNINLALDAGQKQARNYGNVAQDFAEREGNKYADKVSGYANEYKGRAEKHVAQTANRVSKQGLDFLDKKLGGKGVAKGSQEAKDKMAALRAMRGNGFFKNISRKVKKTGKKLGNQAVSKAKSEGKKLGRQVVNRVKDEGKNVLKKASRSALDASFSTLGSIAPPGFSLLVDPLLDKAERAANRKLDKQIDGLGVSSKGNYTLGQNYPKTRIMHGGSFLM